MIDDFDGTGSLEASPGFPSLSREVVAPDPATGDNPNTLLNTPIDNFNEDGEGGDGPCKEQPNDGPNWVMNVPGGAPDWQRDIVAFDIDPDEHQTEICYDCDAGHFVSGAGGATGISTFIYKSIVDDVTGDPIAPIDVFEGRDNCDLVQICFEYASDQPPTGETEPTITFTFISDLDGEGGAAPIQFSVSTSQGDLPNTGNSAPVNLTQVCLDVDDPNEQAVLTNLTRVEIEVDGSEVPDLDLTLDCIELVIDCPGRGGNLAETDTFAQVTEDGAFSFSESLAAYDPADVMMIA